MLNRLGDIIRKSPDCLKVGERFTLLVLEDSRGDNGIYPSVATVAKRVGCSERAAQRYLARLKELGLITMVDRKRISPEGAVIRTTAYRINYDVFDRIARSSEEAYSPEEMEPPATEVVIPAEAPQEPEHPKPAPVVEPPREDVEEVAAEMAASVERRTSRKPAITKAWRDDIRRLIDIDGVTVSDAIAAIRWAEQDDFWAPNILSPKKLRKHYQTMSLKASKQRAHSFAAVSVNGAVPTDFVFGSGDAVY